MDELNFFPFYLDLFNLNQEKDTRSRNNADEEESSFIEWQQEYELINVSHQLEYGW
jgi:hypothetical protein